MVENSISGTEKLDVNASSIEEIFKKLDEISSSIAGLQQAQANIADLQQAQANLDWKLKIIQNREVDRDISLQYLTRKLPVNSSHGTYPTTLIDTGDAFIAPPDDYVPEHPLSR